MQADVTTSVTCGQVSTIMMSDALPINCVSWYLAHAFCAWDGGFLPTEAQWNCAAVGGSEQRVWPWSNPPTQNFVNTIVAVINTTQPSNVGSRSPMGDAKWGHADMVGNVLEQLLDWYADPYTNPCIDCAQLTPGTDRANRAGHYQTTNNAYASPSFRNLGAPTDRQSQIGVRCARK